jgi:hypothetical protein
MLISRRPATIALAALLIVPATATAQITERNGTPLVRDPNTQPVVYDPNVPRTFEAAPPPPPPPPGPPPQGIRFESSATYGIFARIAWNPASNVTSYEVSRAKRDDVTCCNASSGPLSPSTTSWTDVGLFKAGYYSYTVTVNYADGSVGKSGVDLLLQQGASPAPVTVRDIAPGQVRIEWNRGVPGTCCVKIFGPGFGAAGEKMVVGGGPVDLPILPVGTYTWKVAAAYNAENLPVQAPTNYGATTAYGSTYVVLAPPSEWAEVTHTIKYGTGRYRISLEGFKAINVTAEDPFRHDGRGDEVFITTQVSEHWRNGSMSSTRMVRTPTFGDKQNFPARVQAGSASPQGGIMPNDRYPAEAQLISQLQPATTSNLPYVLWEGELTEIDNAVILSPAIWESDEGDELLTSFANFHSRAAPNVAYRDKFNPYIPNTYGRPMLDTWNPQKSCPKPLGPDSPPTLFVPAINGWRDEPMDMNQDHSYCPTYVAINWKMANAMTTVNPATVLEIPFNSPANWAYRLYIRVEKVAPAAQAVPVVAPRSTRRAAGP